MDRIEIHDIVELTEDAEFETTTYKTKPFEKGNLFTVIYHHLLTREYTLMYAENKFIVVPEELVVKLFQHIPKGETHGKDT